MDRSEYALIKIGLQLPINLRPRIVRQHQNIQNLFVQIYCLFIMLYFIEEVEDVQTKNLLLVLGDLGRFVWAGVPSGQGVVF